MARKQKPVARRSWRGVLLPLPRPKPRRLKTIPETTLRRDHRSQREKLAKTKSRQAISRLRNYWGGKRAPSASFIYL